MRKDVLKKSHHASGSGRLPTTSRSASIKHLSPGIKRNPLMSPRKGGPSTRMNSASPQRSLTRHSMQGSSAPVERTRNLKRPKFEKKLSPPLIRRDIPSHGIQDPTSYHDERYLSSRSSVRESHFSPPLKKKIRRETDRFRHDDNPSMMQSPEISMHSDNRIPLRREVSSLHPASSISHSNHHRGHVSPTLHDDHYEIHDQGRRELSPVMSSSHSKRPPAMKGYDSQHSERYRSSSPVDQYASSSEKRYAPTLNERFSAVVESNRTEPKIKYSRDDLEKIVIGIRRNIKAESPTLRRIVDPDDARLVRRTNESHRPMFDREEIKHAPRDMKEDAYYEKKNPGAGIYKPTHSVDRVVENYEITRDSNRPTFHSTSGRSLSERWQNPEKEKETILDRDDREFDRQHVKRNYVSVRRSKSGDRDFRPERYPATESIRGKTDYPGEHRMLSPPGESRNLTSHRKESTFSDARKKLRKDREIHLGSHSESRSRYPPVSEKHYSDGLTRIDKHHDEHRPSVIEPPHKWVPKKRSPIREEKFPEYSRKTEKYGYKAWSDDLDFPPRSSNYYENIHDNSESYRGRGGSRPFRGSRGRGRGGRGSFPSRSNYRGGYRNSSTFRGRGGSRRDRFSPGFWEHDLYSRLSEDRKMDLP
ncbi:uncharacterized protein CDAR_233791 [Caerostris darwini]|uniref:Transformer n=1 Tax=Caerostris darwini TaxID=1538125 RepID=A0AAV4PV56_9ARAC|nr:uncharacterized protein CDAR_233791 [Caerostris darwini]